MGYAYEEWLERRAEQSDAEIAHAKAEVIVSAAIRIPVSDEWREKTWNGVRSYPDYLIISAQPPARHHTLMHPFYDYHERAIGPLDQGFLTSTGRYVDRREAMEIVTASRQPVINHEAFNGRELYSEDLW